MTCETMGKQPLVSIIIPCKEVDHYARNCVEYCKRLDYGNSEILLLPDNVREKVDGVKIVPTGPVTPGAKRNIGIAKSRGEICAFIDSDAYPRKDWLKNAIEYFNDPQVAAVGGPGVTPSDDDFMQKASGLVLSSLMVGNLSNRYKARKCFESNDIHSCNFIVRKSILVATNGWNEKYWPGEDTLTCLSIKRLGKRLVEASDVVVYHHRRPLFKEHLRQVWKFGVHRGFFARRYRGNSFKLTYFVPSLFVSSLFTGVVVSTFDLLFAYAFLLAIMVYLILCLGATLLDVKEAKLVLPVWLGIIVTHIAYGTSFVAGLLKRDLRR